MCSLLIEQFSSINTVDLIIKIIKSIIQLVFKISQFLNSILVAVQRAPPYNCATSNKKVLTASQNTDISPCVFHVGLALYLTQFLAACLFSMPEKSNFSV